MKTLVLAAAAALAYSSAANAEGITPHADCSDTMKARCAAPQKSLPIAVFANAMAAAGFTSLSAEELIQENEWTNVTIDDTIPSGVLVKL